MVFYESGEPRGEQVQEMQNEWDMARTALRKLLTSIEQERSEVVLSMVARLSGLISADSRLPSWARLRSFGEAWEDVCGDLKEAGIEGVQPLASGCIDSLARLEGWASILGV